MSNRQLSLSLTLAVVADKVLVLLGLSSTMTVRPLGRLSGSGHKQKLASLRTTRSNAAAVVFVRLYAIGRDEFATLSCKTDQLVADASSPASAGTRPPGSWPDG